jgi:hypothetical protein
MFKRIRNREKMVLAVRVSGQTADGEKFNALTHTVDIAINGARLGGMFHLPLRKGDIIKVRRNNRTGTFRVVWVGAPDSHQYGHVGIQAVRVPADFWGLELPEKGEERIRTVLNEAR